jgi:PA14 domain
MKCKNLYSFIILLTLFYVNNLYAQYPGNVSTGSVRGYKVDYFNGTFTAVTQFGVGTTNATPARTAYSNKISGTEFNNADVDYYGMEYTGVLEIATAGSYTFEMTADDFVTLYIDGNPVFSSSYTSGATSASIILPAGDHTIKIKFYEQGGANSATLKLTAVPAAATGFTLPADVDGRFVRYDGAKLTAWYKASDLGVTVNGGGAGIDKVNNWINKAPDFVGSGNMTYSVTSGSSSERSTASSINFNPAVVFNGDDVFATSNTIKGLSFRGATKTMFGVANYTSNTTQTNAWIFLHASSNTVTNGNMFGMLKANNGMQTAVYGSANSSNSTWTTFEPKLLVSTLAQSTGSLAPSATNPIYAGTNGLDNPTPSQLTSNVVLQQNFGLRIGTNIDGNRINAARLPEFIYYPWELSVSDKQKVNTYLGIKYGITLAHDYVNTSGTAIYSLTSNAGYLNRIFGIGREDNEALNQKQSQSQMVSGTNAGHDFMVLSKGTAITTTNASNTGVLNDGDYLILGDNAGALASQATELPASFMSSTTCAVARLTREWKAQVTGNPGNVTVRVGNSTMKFSGTITGLVMLVDTDGDGNFETGTVTSHPVTSVVNGIATFSNVPIADGNVITFGWTLISPGGVSNGLKLWTKADLEDFSTGNVSSWTDLSPNFNHLIRTANANVQKQANQFNFNPAVGFLNTENVYLSSTASLSMFGSNTHSEFYVFKGIHPSGEPYDEVIALGAGSGGGGHRWENTTTSAATARLYAYGGGVTGLSAPTDGPLFTQLGLYSTTRNGTGAGFFWSNGVVRRTEASPGALAATGVFRIGTDVIDDSGESDYASFYAPELIVYNSLLSDTEIRRINSYLGIKYSIPLADGSGTSASEYLSASGTTIWSSTATHKYGMFGIGRDDCSGLNQKQSKAYLGSDDNVTIGKGSIVATNEDNTNEFAANNNFVVVAHDNAAFTGIANNSTAYALISCNPYRYERTWKVYNTGSVTGLQIKIGNTTNYVRSNWSNIALMIDGDGDGDFSNATLVTAVSYNAGVATFNNVTLPHNAVFTLAYTSGTPGGVSKPTSGTTTLGATYVNGLAYKLYTTNGPTTRNLLSVPLGSLGTDALVSTGYINNASNDFEDFFTAKMGADFGFELKGKIFAPRSGTYTFRGVVPDDQLVLIIDGTPIFNATTYVAGATVSGTINLAAGQYYDFTYIGATSGGDGFNLQWDGPTAGTFGAITDANLFVSPSGPSAWYMADDLDLSGSFAEGATIATWKDLSANGNAITATGNPTFYYTNTGFMTNYNPSVYFTTDYLGTSNYLNGFAYSKQGKSVFVTSANNTGTATIYTAFGNDASGNLFGLHKFASGQLMLLGHTVNTLESGSFYGSATVTTDIISGKYSNQNIIPSNNTNLYANGAQLAIATQNTWNTIMKSSSQFFIGAWPGAANGYYTNNMNEVIYYPWDLSAIELQRVNSYLAIKWGRTLSQAIPTSYLASDGTKVWDHTLSGASSFNNDITVIGRDDCGALNQKQSTSTDGADIVSIGNAGSLVVNNASNTNNFSADKTFIAYAHNDAALTSFSDPNLPAALVATNCYSRLTREWQAQVTGTAGPVSLEFGKAGLLTFGVSTFKPMLIVRDSGSANYSGANFYPATKTVGGKVYFDNISLTNGQYFTVAYIVAAPGGVKTALTVWFDAGKEVYTDDAGATEAIVADDKVGYLKNIATNTVLQNVNQTNNTYKPILKLADLNYNPALAFASNGLSLTSASVSSDSFRTTSTMSTFVAGWNVGGGGASDIIWGHFSGAGSGVSFRKGSVNWANGNISSAVINSNPMGGQILSATYTSGSGNMFLNAANNGTLSGSTSSAAAAAFLLGANTTGTNSGYNMGETIVYSDDKSTPANLVDRRKIASYLSIKYGFTQNAAGMGNAYLASNGATIYDYTTHWNRITGIGRDDCSAFEQKQSLSQDADALVRISSDITNGLAASNNLNLANFSSDKTFFIFGDNGKSATWTGVDQIPGDLVRLNRIWRVKETGTVADVYLQVPANESAASIKLPASTNIGDPVYLLVSATGNFKNPDQIVEMTRDANNYMSTSYNFNNGDYYTFASTKTCIAPAGISEGLTSWFRTDDYTLASTIVDKTGSYTLTRNAAGAAIVSASLSSNYNRYLNLNGTYYQSTATLGATAITKVNEGTLFGVSFNGTNNRLFALSKPSNNGVQLSTLAEWANATITGAYAGSSIANTADIIGLNYNGSSFITSRNGTSMAPIAATASIDATTTTYGLRLGASYNAAVLTAASPNANLMEAISYNRSLSTHESEVINTYLALKYGQTIGAHNYFSADYDGSNASSATIYDVSNYGNRVFGVGNDITGCFYQNQSTSALVGNMLKISVDGILNLENSQAATIWNNVDRAYTVIGDNNGSLVWGDVNKPYTVTNNDCAKRILRQWKVTTTGVNPSMLITLPAYTGAAPTKLPDFDVLNATNRVYMVVNDSPDFTINSNQIEMAMTLNTTSNEWEVNTMLPADTTKYITFIYKPKTCRTAVITNPNIAGGKKNTN